jgi:hypothetical protein
MADVTVRWKRDCVFKCNDKKKGASESLPESHAAAAVHQNLAVLVEEAAKKAK